MPADAIRPLDPVLQLVMRWDVHHDRPGRWNEGLAELQRLGAFDLPTLQGSPKQWSRNDARRAAGAVGAHWCAIVAHDVRWRLGRAYDAFEDSRALAGALHEWIAAGSSDQAQPEIAYATARWYDGAARLAYRSLDYGQAVEWFALAAELSTRFALSCEPDVRSNLLRATAEREAQLVATGDSKAAAAFMDCVGLLRRLVETWMPRAQSSSDFAAEVARGIGTALLNIGVVLLDKLRRPEEADRELWTAVCHARGLSDRYREGQALLNLYLARRRTTRDIDEPLARLKEIEPEVAVRTLLIRDQNLAEDALRRLTNTTGPEADATRWQAMAELLRIIDTLEADLRRRGGEMGFDLPMWDWTVRLLGQFGHPAQSQEARRRVQERVRMREVFPLGPEERDFAVLWARFLAGEQLAVARAQRQIHRLSQYKRQFNQKVVPLYCSIVDRLEELGIPEGDRLAGALRLTEEAAVRDALDAVAAAQSGVQAVVVEGETLAPDAGADAGSPVASGTRRRGRRRRSAHVQGAPGPDGMAPSRRRGRVRRDAADDAAVAAARDARERLEQELALRPLPIQPPDEQIDRRLAQLTAAQRGLVVVRFHVPPVTGPGKPRLGAARAFVCGWGELCEPRAGQSMDPVECSQLFQLDGAKQLLPTAALATRLWEGLLRPALASLRRPGQSPIRELILVPSGELFDLPLHAAWVPEDDAREMFGAREIGGRPLAMVVPLSHCVSATALVSRNRVLNRSITLRDSDDLLAVAPGDVDEVGHELSRLRWTHEVGSVSFAGDPALGPRTVGGRAVRHIPLDPRRILQEAVREGPEFVYLAAHGTTARDEPAAGVIFDLPQSDGSSRYLSCLDLVVHRALHRNKLAVFATCVSGSGSRDAGLEVGGMLKAVAAAGGAAAAISLWNVHDRVVEEFAAHLFRSLFSPGQVGKVVDLPKVFQAAAVGTERSISRLVKRGGADVADLGQMDGRTRRIECCPFALYL